MVDTANPADPERRRLHDDRQPGRESFVATQSLARNRGPRRAAPAGHVGGHLGSGPPRGCARDGPSPLQDRSAAARGWTRPRAFDSRGYPSPNSGVGARSSIQGTLPSTTRSCTAGCVSGTARRRFGSPRWCSVCSRSRSCTRSVGRSATIASGSSPRCCSRSPRSRSGTRRRRAGIRSSPSERRRRCWASPTSFATRNDREPCARPAGRCSPTCSERPLALLAHNTAVFLPIGANVLMLGWWWTHGREPRGFLRNWLLAQVAVLCLWASWLPAYLHQVADGGAYSWIPRPTVGSVLSGAYAVYGGVTRATPYPLEAVVVVALAASGCGAGGTIVGGSPSCSSSPSRLRWAS